MNDRVIDARDSFRRAAVRRPTDRQPARSGRSMAPRPRSAPPRLGRGPDLRPPGLPPGRLPIGSLLVCRVRQEAHVLVESGGTRRAQNADAGTWQLLDGQQRVNALVCLFTEHGQFGRFHVDMTRKRVPEEVVTRRRDKRHALDYIAWRPDDAGGTEPIDGRERYIDLSRLQAWAASLPEGAIESTIADVEAGSGENRRDPERDRPLVRRRARRVHPHAGDRPPDPPPSRLDRAVDPRAALHGRQSARRPPGLHPNQPRGRPTRRRGRLLRRREDRVAGRRGAPRSRRRRLSPPQPDDCAKDPRSPREPRPIQGRPASLAGRSS